MGFEKIVEKYRVKAVYKYMKGDKIILGVLSESEDVDLQGLANSFGADEAILIKLDDPSTRYIVLNGILLVSADDEYRKNVETKILEKVAEKKLENIENVIDELL